MNNHRVAQFHLVQGIRNFFMELDFTDVITPPMVTNPGMETHIHPFKLMSAYGGKIHDLYLHTSPEFAMKELLSDGMERIFNISYCFRDEPDAPHHRNQFIMLEWYRTNSDYHKIMDDCEGLITYCADFLKKKGHTLEPRLKNLNFTRMTVAEVFNDILGIQILDYLDTSSLRKLIKENYKDVPLPQGELTWDDLYFLLFLNKVEPKLERYPYLLIYEFPHHLSALSTIKKDDQRVCERFEIYMFGVELCNCFNELRDLKIQKERFSAQKIEKNQCYNYELPDPEVLYNAIEKGFPPSGGIALGVERLLMALTGTEKAFWS
ncbi:MAG: hypothetical protein KAG61_13065 [Bacteriovoracaceae bacterium]|nr:hypothetical protein [Bacteriovoracaceae bacterium]